eukprot:Phypoly_transcript_13273.p1 GENE.Phypoly_transcript_13273~~Phypoly_transcript_13273.p1  ORF type:complete len:314 (+),score=25.43 Phypoly_transcript_13273:42-944(+)
MAQDNNPCFDGTPHGRAAFARILVDMNTMSIIFGIFLIIGSVISVLPQHYKIWKNKTSVGVSFLWLFLGSINQFAGALNAVVLKFPQEQACTVLGLGRCLPSLLSLIQLSALFIFTFPIYLWCLKFLDYRNTTPRERKIARILFGVLIIFFFVVSLIATVLILFTGECSRETVLYGSGLGLLSTIVTFIQWSPQIYATFKRKSVGSFSILMLCIQCPGSALIVYFLIFASHEQVTTWLSYVSSLVQQIVLLILLVYYHYKNKPAKVNMSINTHEKESLLNSTPPYGHEEYDNSKSLPSLT